MAEGAKNLCQVPNLFFDTLQAIRAGDSQKAGLIPSPELQELYAYYVCLFLFSWSVLVVFVC